MHYGPLTAITGGIAVASNDALHLRITPEGVTHHRGATVISETIPWSDIIGIEVNLPSSWFPWPGALATTGYALVTLLSGQVENVHSEESSITVSLADDKHLELPVNHAVGGYWKRAVTNAGILLNGFIAKPEQRSLLAHPEQVIHRYANATRWRTRLTSE